MAFVSHQVVSVCLILLTAGFGCEAACTNEELDLLFTCIIPYNAQFETAIGLNSSTCNRGLITSELCTSFGQIVTCVNGKNVSDVTCRPGAAAQINPNMQIPCKIEDFVAVCDGAPAINMGGTTTPPTTTPSSGDGSLGSKTHADVTLFLLVTSVSVTALFTGRR